MDQAPAVFSSRFVRELKGAPLSVLVLLLIADQPVSNDWLENMSGYSDKPVAAALSLLSSPEYQYVVKTFKGWRISDTFNLPLINRRNSVPTTTTNILINTDINQVVVAESENFRFMRNMETCKEVGIGDPSATAISQLEHVTPEFIRAHKAALVRGETIGLAIVRIKNNEPVMVANNHDQPAMEAVTFLEAEAQDVELSEPEPLPDFVLDAWEKLDAMIERKGKVRAQYSNTRLLDFDGKVLTVKTVGDVAMLQGYLSQVNNQIQLAVVSYGA